MAPVVVVSILGDGDLVRGHRFSNGLFPRASGCAEHLGRWSAAMQRDPAGQSSARRARLQRLSVGGSSLEAAVHWISLWLYIDFFAAGLHIRAVILNA
jgi:hypothetical protein